MNLCQKIENLLPAAGVKDPKVRVVVVGLDYCPFTRRCKEVLERKKENFLLVEIGHSQPVPFQSGQQFGKNLGYAGTFPVVCVGDSARRRHIGGSDELVAWLNA
jgi:glutaredoxin